MTQQHLAKVFRFHESRFDPNTGTAVLSYSFDDGEPLEETLIFPYSPWPEDSARQSAFMRALGLLHLVAGVSYWKAALPERIEVGDHAVDDSLSRFLTETWTRGLGEFAYVNDLDLTHRIRFPVTDSGAETAAAAERVAQPLELPARALVAMGGGQGQSGEPAINAGCGYGSATNHRGKFHAHRQHSESCKTSADSY